MSANNFEIDLVYLWVDGSDSKWQQKKQAFTQSAIDKTETNTEGRYADNDELKYSLRSVEKYAPWIRTIFIVTDSQQPSWLDINNPKIRLVDHTEIIPSEILPLFNAIAIEYFLHNIPGLSEHFLFANDDMFFNANLGPDYFFADDGNPYVFLKKKKFGKWYHRFRALLRDEGHYRRTVVSSMNLVEKKCGKFYSGLPHHNIDPYRKSDYRNAVEEVFEDEVRKSKYHRLRTEGDFHRSAIGYYALAIGHGHVKYVNPKISDRMQIFKLTFKETYELHKPLLFCLNDNEQATFEHRQQVKPFLESIYPEKSSFEI